MDALIIAWTGLRWQRRSVWTLIPYKLTRTGTTSTFSMTMPVWTVIPYSDSLDAIATKVVWTVLVCRPTQENNAGGYVQENSPLQGAPEPAHAEPGATEINRDKEQKERIEASPSTDKRHSQVADPPKPKIAKEVEIKVWALIFGLPAETDVTRFADQHIVDRLDADGGAFTVERVAEKAREHLGRDEPLEAYIPYVQRCLDEKRAEGMQVEAAS
jgi:hypothetical protein